MALMDELRTKLTAIGNAIRGKTGNSAELTLDEMVEAIERISTGGSGGGGSTGGGSSDSGSSTATIEGGYTVNFHNTDNVLIESHSALFGNWIDKPISYEVHHWQNENGHMNNFPLTVSTEDSGIVFDLYPAVMGENAVYLINPNGTDFGTTFLQADGTAQSGWTDNHGNGGITPNYTENEYKLKFYATAGSTHYGKNTFNDVINCVGYKYLKVKWYYKSVWYAGSDSGSFYIYLSKDINGSGTYIGKQINNPNNNYNAAYYKAKTGDSSWTEESTLNNLDSSGWHWTIIDISDLTEFYLTIAGNYYSYIAEIIMTE